jgi:hypothetical protein
MAFLARDESIYDTTGGRRGGAREYDKVTDTTGVGEHAK